MIYLVHSNGHQDGLASDDPAFSQPLIPGIQSLLI